jgi:flagellar secretion chaperone FliS
MNITTPINIYNKVGTESSVMSADPHKLISMLFHGALLAIANAKNGMLRKETAVKGKSISRAIAIIGEGLHTSLDKSVGGELAQNLSSLYVYMVMRLVDANLNNDITALDEVTRLLTELTEAWDSIRPNNVQSEPQLKIDWNTY